jgi:anti-sigma regulatory factor (Ser/Thr protein kinase)
MGGDAMGSQRLGSWRLPAVPASVPELRRAVRAAIADHGFDDVAVGLAVTEAVTNVVRHAYPGSVGSVTLSADASPQELALVVADEGAGRRSFALRADPGLGIGLALIRELCSRVRIDPTNTGTTVTMHFAKSADPPKTPA